MSFPDPLMTKSDVAAVLRCCERTVERQVKLGAFPPPQRFGKESLWFESVVHRWLGLRREQQQQWTAALTEPASPTMAQPVEAEVATPVKPKQSRSSRAKPWEASATAEPRFRSA